MSNRTLLEFNHDLTPPREPERLALWASQIRLYLTSGNPEELPAGVTFVRRRHHSEPFMNRVPPREGFEP